MAVKIIKNKKQKITIDKLARMTSEGFSKVDQRFSKADERFDRVENTITDLRIMMDKRLNSMEEKMEKSADKMLIIADGMTKEFLTWKQENAFGAGIESRQNQQLENHEKRIIKIEQKIIL